MIHALTKTFVKQNAYHSHKIDFLYSYHAAGDDTCMHGTDSCRQTQWALMLGHVTVSLETNVLLQSQLYNLIHERLLHKHDSLPKTRKYVSGRWLELVFIGREDMSFNMRWKLQPSN